MLLLSITENNLHRRLPKKSVGKRELELNQRKIGPTCPQTVVSKVHDSQTVETLSDDCDRPPKMTRLCTNKRVFTPCSLTYFPFSWFGLCSDIFNKLQT